MVLDANLMFSNAQALTATAVSTNVVDLGAVTPKRQIGDGEPLCVIVAVGVAADFTTGDETYEIEIEQSATANMASPTIIARQPFLTPLLKAGAVIAIPIPPNYPTQEFISVNYVLGGTTPTATVSAWLSPMSFVQESGPGYASGFTVS